MDGDAQKRKMEGRTRGEKSPCFSSETLRSARVCAKDDNMIGSTVRSSVSGLIQFGETCFSIFY